MTLNSDLTNVLMKAAAPLHTHISAIHRIAASHTLLRILPVFALCALFIHLPALAADPWPGDLGTTIWDGREPSGIVWHDRLERLIWVDDGIIGVGRVYKMDINGNVDDYWTPGSDLEGVAIADSATNYVYVGVENPDSIMEFDISTGALTGKTWDLTTWMEGPDSQGLEALTFVPNGSHPYDVIAASGGLFYAGLQDDGKIYVFDVNLSVSGDVTPIHTITPVSGRGDLSGLHYEAATDTLYAVYDSSNLLREMETDGTFIAEYILPGSTQEGVTIIPLCISGTADIYIAQDSGEVMEYGNYPVVCDSDGDGLTDVEELNTYLTSADDPDSDDDFFSDYIEIVCGTDPNLDSDKPDTVKVNFQPSSSALPHGTCLGRGKKYRPIGYGW